MSSLFLLPVPRDAQPPVDIWKRGPEIKVLIDGLEDQQPLASAFVITESENWTVKHISLYQNVLVYRSVEEKLLKDRIVRKPGAVRGAYEFIYNKMDYAETTLGMMNKNAWSFFLEPNPDDKSSISSSSNQVRYIKYVRISDNPFEEISEYFYFKSDEEQELWRDLLSKMRILNINFATKYLVQGKIGSGGYSKVYLVKDTRTELKYAAKAIFLEKLAEEFDRAKDMIVNEVESMHLLLPSGHVPQLFEVHQVEDVIYLVMEYIDGLTLTNFMKKRLLKRDMTPLMIHCLLR
jgi:hypothetical protein